MVNWKPAIVAPEEKKREAKIRRYAIKVRDELIQAGIEITGLFINGKPVD